MGNAIELLIAERNDLAEDRERIMREKRDLAAEVERLREALEFYRDEWAVCGREVAPSAALSMDCGYRARAAQEGRP